MNFEELIIYEAITIHILDKKKLLFVINLQHRYKELKFNFSKLLCS